MASAETLTQIMNRLYRLGFDTEKHNISDLNFYADLVYDIVTNNLCRDSIPQKLWRVYIDMVCGEFLYEKFINGDLDDLFNQDLQRGDITSVRLGDMTVNLKEVGTDVDVFLDRVNYLRKQPDHRYLFDIFRDFLP